MSEGYQRSRARSSCHPPGGDEPIGVFHRGWAIEVPSYAFKNLTEVVCRVKREMYIGGGVMGNEGVNRSSGADLVWNICSGAGSDSGVGIPAIQSAGVSNK